MSDEPEKQDRRATLARVLLENVGGLLALAGVIASGGMIMERLANQGRLIDEARATQKVMASDVSGIRENVTAIREKIAVHEAEINHLKRGQ